MSRFLPFKGPSTFRARIFWSIIPIFLVLFGLLGAINFQQQNQMVKSQFMKRGEVMVNNLAYSAELGVFAENAQLLEPSIRGMEIDADVAYVFVYGEQDKLLTKGGQQVDQASAESLDLSTEQRSRLLTERQPISRQIRGTSAQFIEFVAPVVPEAETTPDELLLGLDEPSSQQDAQQQAIGFVRLGLSLGPLQRNTRAFIELWIGLAVAFLVLSTLAMHFLSKRITQPIKHLTNHADKIAQGDLDQVIPVESHDEIGQLAASF